MKTYETGHAGSFRQSLRRFIKGFGCACRGIYITLKSERNFRVHTIALCLVVILGLYLNLPPIEWTLVLLSAGIVLTAELFNTALERLGDQAAGGQQNELVRNAKDISAAAVLLAALTSAGVGTWLLLLPFLRRVLSLL